MKNSTINQAKGKMHQAKGKVKQEFGRMTDNPEIQGSGAAEKTGGKIQKKAGDVEQVFED
jgi:uncharacterized protein YjbJ (UPF0337 family)